MCDLFRSLGNSLDLVDVLSTFDRELRRLIGYDAISVHLADDARLAPIYAAGDGIADLLAGAGNVTLLTRVAVERQPALHELALVFPLENDGAVIAILALYRCGSPNFSDRDLDLLDVLSVKLSASIANARKFQRAAESAATDPVTGLANVRSLFQHLDAELARARRSGTRLAVLQCSIGGLVESDRFSSPESAPRPFEYALGKLAARLRQSCREYDFSARAGDDMVLVLPGFSPSDFAGKRGLIRHIVEETGLSAGLPLFASVGAAFYPEDGRDAEDLLAESARRLHLARRLDCGGEHVAVHA